MKPKLRFFMALFLLCTLLTVFCMAAEEVFPDSTTGAYEYTYTGATPGKSYPVIMLQGIYSEEDSPLLDPSGSNVLYFSYVRADAEGKLSLSILPSLYRDATVYTSGTDQPTLLFYAKAGDAKEIADFSISMEKTEYIASGDEQPIYVRYTIDAVDSFGFPSTLPSFATRSFKNYTGEKMVFVENSNVIRLHPSMEPGTYTFTISYGGMEREASFTLTHETSVAKKMLVTVDGTAPNKTHYIQAYTGLDTTTYDPEYLEICAATYDQYELAMEDTYTFEYTYIDEDEEYIGDTKTLVAQNSTVRFYPPEIPDFDQRLTYTLTVRSSHPDPNSKNGSLPFEQTFRIMVSGGSVYEDIASKNLFSAYLSANSYIQKIDNEQILLTENGDNIPATKQYVSEIYATALRAETEAAAALLRLHTTEPQSSTALYEQQKALQKAEENFKKNLRNGTIAFIEELYFKNDVVRLPVGRKESIAVTCKPSRPSEKILYSSDTPSVATVDEKGNVTTLTKGEARITATNTDGSIKAYYDLQVYIPIRSLSFAMTKLTLVTGETEKPSLTVKPEEHGDSLTFVSSAPKIVAVSEDGTLTALTAGEATITVQNETGAVTDSIQVTSILPRFSTTAEVRAKPGSQVRLKVSLAEAMHFASMKVVATYPEELTYVKAETDKLSDAYLETVTTASGTLESTWSFKKSLTQASSVDIITYVFDVSETAALKTYTIQFALSAETPSGDSILIDSFSSASKVKVGETDTYTVTVVANGNGSVSGGGAYTYDESVTVTAKPDSNYTLSGWYLNNTLVYSGLNYTFTVTDDVTLTAKFTKKSPGAADGDGGGGGGTTTVLEKVKPVTCDMPSGFVEPGTKITLTTATNQAEIYYTLDGTIPTAGSLRYNEPIEITEQTVTISAIAVKNGMTNSDVATFVFRLPEEEKEDEPKKDEETETNEKDKELVEGVQIAFKENVQSIKYLAVSTSYFRPNDPASRYEVVEMIGKLFDITGVTLPEEQIFEDVADRFKELVETLTAAGVINGYEDGSFRGGQSITRAELVTILARLLGTEQDAIPDADAVSLTDIDEHWAKDTIRRFVAKGYVLGYPEGDFRPDKAVSRAEVVVILNRITGLQKVSGMEERFRDLPSDFWAYEDIMNALEA